MKRDREIRGRQSARARRIKEDNKEGSSATLRILRRGEGRGDLMGDGGVSEGTE